MVGWPLVRVPVLSNRTVVTVRIDSSASRSLTSTPPRAARSVAMETTSGMARPRACGQAITSTVMVRTTAWSGSPSSVHTMAVITPASSANQNSHAAARSAIRCAREEEFCASADQSLDAGQRGVVADGGDLDPQAGVGGHGAGDHRVAFAAADRLGLAGDHRLVHAGVPDRIRPSAGIRPPGRTTTRSPTRRSAGRDHVSVSSGRRRVRPRRAAVRPTSPTPRWSGPGTASRSSGRAA